MAFLEANRYLYLTTPLGDDKLLLRSFEGDEALSRLFSFELEMEAENATNVDFDKLIGQKVSFRLQAHGGRRHLLLLQVHEGRAQAGSGEYATVASRSARRSAGDLRSA